MGAIGIGFYAVFSWASTLRRRDAPTFRLIWGTPAFMLVICAFGISAALNYVVAFSGLPYAESVLHADKATAGLMIGGGSATGGFLGLTIGGRVADRMGATNPAGRIIAILLGFVAPVVPIVTAFTISDKTLFCLMYFPFAFLSSFGQGAVSATSQDLVLPRMRGMATATSFISINMIGLRSAPMRWAGSRRSPATSDRPCSRCWSSRRCRRCWR